MKICITGGTGFIGKYISLYLKNHDHDITVVARSKKSEDIAQKLNLSYIIGDLNNLSELIPKLKQFDAVIHCAFDYSIEFKKSVELDKAFLYDLLDGTNTNLKFFIYTSSAYALHNIKNDIYDESVDITILPYHDKWIFQHENLVLKARDEFLKTAIIRAGMVYGGFGGSIDSFFEEIKKTGKLDMPGNGYNYWSFIHVNDLAIMYDQILKNNATGIFHGVDCKPIKVSEVFNAINSVCSDKSVINKLNGAKAKEKWGLYYNTFLSDIRVTSSRHSDINWTPDKPDFISSIQIVYDEWKNKKINL